MITARQGERHGRTAKGGCVCAAGSASRLDCPEELTMRPQVANTRNRTVATITRSVCPCPEISSRGRIAHMEELPPASRTSLSQNKCRRFLLAGTLDRHQTARMDNRASNCNLARQTEGSV